MGNTHVVEVSCPGCGARFKAPDTLTGKKARCAKCGNSFRIPGGESGRSRGDTPAPGAALPTLPGADEAIPMALAVEETLPLPPEPPPAKPAKPEKDFAVLPSADPFDFSKPAKPAPTPAPASAPAKAPSAPKMPPVAPKPAATPAAPAASAPKSRPASAKPVATGKPVVPTKPTSPPPPPAKPQQEVLSLDDAEPATLDELPPASDNPFAFNGAPEAPARPRRRDEERDDRDDRRNAEREELDEPKPRKKTREESEERERDEPKPKNTREPDKRDEDEPRRKKKKRRRSEGREEPAPAAVTGSNPFAFTAPAAEPAKSGGRDDRDDEDEPRPRKRKKDEDDALAELAGPPRRRQKESSAGLVLLITGAVAFVALLLGVVAVIVYVKKTRPPEQTQKEEKKEEPPVAPPEPPKVEPKAKETAPKPKEAGPKPKAKETPVASKVPTLALPARMKTFAVGPPPDKPEPADKPKAGVVIDSPLAAVRRVFPPFDLRTGDKHVLVQLAAGAGGTGEKLALDTYSASSDRRSGRIEYDGDGRPVPVCDLHASVDGVRFLAAVGGKISVWNADDGEKLHDGIDPYATRPEHQKAGLAAAFFAPQPDQVVTVSTAGAVHLFDLRTRTATDEFVPRNAAPGRVALGRSVAGAEGGGSVVLVAGGVIYQVRSAPGLEVVRTYELGGEAARSLGLAVSGTPGRVLYVFETDKKERAAAGLPLGDDAKLILYRWPAALGEPLGAVWAGGNTGGVATASGVVWFDDDEGRFLPLVVTQPAGPGLHFGDDRAYWYTVPHPDMPEKSVLVALSMPFDDFSDFGKSYANNEPLRTARIDHNGLAK